MSPNPDSFLTHLRQFGYNPRSNKHSNALAESIADNLVHFCPEMRRKVESGDLVYDLNFDLTVGTATWNVDLVMGPPSLASRPEKAERTIIPMSRPSAVEVAIEIKSVMTEHRKAVKNRKRDLEAHHEHVHNYRDVAIAGGVMVINQCKIAAVVTQSFFTPVAESQARRAPMPVLLVDRSKLEVMGAVFESAL